ncbi:MAG: biotin--[acetyl-CoA-carboxylase] ligase [Alphaproteobacteria bacterium]
MDIPFIHRVSCTSTQDVALALLATMPPPFAVTADTQTAGRGQRDRLWHSVSGNLHLTVALPWDGGDADIPAFALLLAKTLCHVIQGSIPQARLKLPNDVYIGDQKIAGMITQRHGNAMLVGMGVNITHAPLTTATCLRDHGITITGDSVARDITRALVGPSHP